MNFIIFLKQEEIAAFQCGDQSVDKAVGEAKPRVLPKTQTLLFIKFFGVWEGLFAPSTLIEAPIEA